MTSGLFENGFQWLYGALLLIVIVGIAMIFTIRSYTVMIKTKIVIPTILQQLYFSYCSNLKQNLSWSSLSRTSYYFNAQIGSVQSSCWLILSSWGKLPYNDMLGALATIIIRELGIPFYLPTSIMTPHCFGYIPLSHQISSSWLVAPA